MRLCESVCLYLCVCVCVCVFAKVNVHECVLLLASASLALMTPLRRGPLPPLKHSQPCPHYTQPACVSSVRPLKGRANAKRDDYFSLSRPFCPDAGPSSLRPIWWRLVSCRNQRNSIKGHQDKKPSGKVGKFANRTSFRVWSAFPMAETKILRCWMF